MFFSRLWNAAATLKKKHMTMKHAWTHAKCSENAERGDDYSFIEQDGIC